MEVSKVDAFIMQNSKMLPMAKVGAIKDALLSLDDSKAVCIQGIEFKDPTTMLIISILLGNLGIDRFMLGEVGMGVLKLLTCGGFYILWIIDMIHVQDKTREYNMRQLSNALALNGVTGLF